MSQSLTIGAGQIAGPEAPMARQAKTAASARGQ